VYYKHKGLKGEGKYKGERKNIKQLMDRSTKYTFVDAGSIKASPVNQHKSTSAMNIIIAFSGG
jgi:hypothetical protein